MSSSAERRIHGRVDVRWSVTVWRSNGDPPLKTETENISSRGFYCFSSQCLAPGEVLSCAIEIPTRHPIYPDQTLSLKCSAQVVWAHWIEAKQQFGIGCSIDDYSVIPEPHEMRTQLPRLDRDAAFSPLQFQPR
jgi:hypothetical protein